MRHCPECCLWYCYFPCYQQGCCWLCSSYWLLQERVVAAAAPGRVVVDAATGLLLQLLLYLVNVFFGHTAPPTQPRPLTLFEKEPINPQIVLLKENTICVITVLGVKPPPAEKIVAICFGFATMIYQLVSRTTLAFLIRD